MRRPGIEPGSKAWEASMLTITPAALVFGKTLGEKEGDRREMLVGEIFALLKFMSDFLVHSPPSSPHPPRFDLGGFGGEEGKRKNFLKLPNFLKKPTHV